VSDPLSGAHRQRDTHHAMPVTIQGYESLPGVSMTFAMGFLDFVAKGHYWNSSLRLCHSLISIGGGKQEPEIGGLDRGRVDANDHLVVFWRRNGNSTSDNSSLPSNLTNDRSSKFV